MVCINKKQRHELLLYVCNPLAQCFIQTCNIIVSQNKQLDQNYKEKVKAPKQLHKKWSHFCSIMILAMERAWNHFDISVKLRGVPGERHRVCWRWNRGWIKQLWLWLVSLPSLLKVIKTFLVYISQTNPKLSKQTRWIV